MVRNFAKYIFALILICVTYLAQTTTPEIEQQNQMLQSIRNEIASLQNELQHLTAEEKNSVAALEKINQRNLLISRLISNLEREEKQKENEINNLNSQIDQIGKDINNLQETYAGYVIWVYKNSGLKSLDYLVNAGSINQALIRYKYLSYITDQKEETLTSLKQKKVKYSSLIGVRKNEIAEKEKVVAEKRDEQKLLASKKDEKQSVINKLEANQNALVNEIEEKRKAEIKIKNLISRLIEDERSRQEKIRLARMNNEEVKVTYDYEKFENFSNLRGRLNWPVRSGSIVRNFGENTNKKLNTVTLNYGVDIVTDKNEKVFAVAEGIVSAIEWLPGYGSVVILTHRNDYRTVYGHLSEISVNEGDKVDGGTLLGTVNESLEGNIIHFEIWNERNYQNPETWLVSK